MKKLTFKDQILPAVGLWSIAGFIVCVLIFIWADSATLLKLVSKIAGTLGIVAIISIQVGKILAKIEQDETN